VLEGLTYFGVVGLLAIFFNDFIALDDIDAGRMVGILTAGITIAMLFLGATVDWIGLRKSLLISLLLMLVGRVLLTMSPDLGAPGFGDAAHIIAMLGIMGIILGYGIYQPACYAGVKQLTNEKTSAMGYAMLYALMNLGGFLPGIISPPIRKAFGIPGVFWVYVVLTVVGIGAVYFIITKKAMEKAVKQAAEEAKSEKIEEEKDEMEKLSRKEKVVYYFKNFPLKDLRFLYFVFILIFVQTLFAHNWLTLPQYTSRAFEGFVSDNFEYGSTYFYTCIRTQLIHFNGLPCVDDPGRSKVAATLFTVGSGHSTKEYDRNIYGNWAIPLVFNEGDYISLFRMVPDELLPCGYFAI
jgi:MFS family permease